MNFEYGQTIVLVNEKGHKHLVPLKEKGMFHTQYGAISHESICDTNDGGRVFTTKNHPYFAFSLTYSDFVMNIKRNAQIIYPKDSSVMMTWGDIAHGSKVLEAGIGQGALSIKILQAIGGEGELVSYEKREDFAKQSQAFIRQYLVESSKCPLPVDKMHRVEVRDIYEGIGEMFERVMLDLPEPWQVIPHLMDSLEDGGIVVSYLPSIIQVSKYVDALEASGAFKEIETFELILRPWKVSGRSVRPEMWTYNHSAFIIKARKVAAKKDAPTVEEPPIPESIATEKDATD